MASPAALASAAAPQWCTRTRPRRSSSLAASRERQFPLRPAAVVVAVTAIKTTRRTIGTKNEELRTKNEELRTLLLRRGRIRRPEANRHEPEPCRVRRHHRPVLGPRQMQHRVRVPEHDVLIDDRPVAGAPHLDTFAIAADVDPLARRVHLARIEQRHPQLMLEKRRAA